MLFQKDHLSGSYNWADEDTSMYKDTPTRRMFDRFNGYQVLFIINLCGSTLEDFSVKRGQDFERLLLNNLPLTTGSEISVFKWLLNFKEAEI